MVFLESWKRGGLKHLYHTSSVHAFLISIASIIDVLLGQPIKLIQVASNSELREINGTAFFSSKLVPLIASGPQKCKHKIGHKYFTFQHPKKLEAFFEASEALQPMTWNNFKEKKAALLIFMQFWSRSHMNKLDWLTPQDVCLMYR